LYLPYIPGLTQPNQGLTTIAPGSSYQIISRDAFATTKWSITYAGVDVDRLPLATDVKTPLFMIGLDKNSIVVPISSYVLGENSPLSSIGQMRLTNGTYASINQFNAADVKNGLYFGDTHFRPNSAYRLRNRVPFTFFAPLQSEMGDAYATGQNTQAQIGMGYQSNSYGFTQLYGNWDKVSISQTHAVALSTCGTKKKLFVCGQNDYGQLGLTPVVNYTLQRPVTALQPVWREVTNLWWNVSDITVGECNGGFYKDALSDTDNIFGLSTETIIDAEAGDNFTLVRTNNQLYGIGSMFCLGICAPGIESCSGPQFVDVKYQSSETGNFAVNAFLATWTPYLNRDGHLSINTSQAQDFSEYYEIYSNQLQKFQAGGMRWYALIANRLYGAGKVSGVSTSVGITGPAILPRPAGSSSQASTLVQLNSPHFNYNNTFIDFEANITNIVALSSDYKRWFIGGALNSAGTSSRGLSTMAFYDPQQNAYIPQNNYFLRLFPSFYGAIGIMNGQLYSTGQGVVVSNFLGSAIAGFGGTKTTADLPSTTLPKINNALSPNDNEYPVLQRSLIPIRHINPNSPNVSWNSLFCSNRYTCALDLNNKLYICGDNSRGQLGAPQETTAIYTLSNIITDNVFNLNTNTYNAVIYKTNRNPATSPLPIPSQTPTKTPTPTPTKTPRPTPVPYSDSGVEGFGFFTSGIANNSTDLQAYMYYTTATDYGFNLNPGGYLASVSINQSQAILPQCTGTFAYYPNGGAFLVNNRFPSASRAFYNNRDFARCVFGWGRNNRFYAIAYTTDPTYNLNSNLYLFKPHISYPAQGGGTNSTVNRPVVACLPVAGSNNDGVEIPVTNRGYIEALNGNQFTTFGSRRAQIDFQFSPYTQKCGILYWRTGRTYPQTTGRETIYLTYAESSTNNDLNTWTTGNTIDTNFYELAGFTTFYNAYLMIKPKLYYDKTDSPTALYLKGSGTSKEILTYKNINTNETLSIATGHENPFQATDSELMLNVDQPDYQLIFNNNNKPVIFFNGWRTPFLQADYLYSGTNMLRCYFNGTTSNVMTLSVIRLQTESTEVAPGKALIGNTFYDLYYESSTDTVYIAYMDDWNVGFGKGLPRSIRVINYNYQTNTINSTETVYVLPANFRNSSSYASNSFFVKGLKMFFDKRLQKIIVTYSIFRGSSIGPTTVEHAFYQRNGLNDWVNISPDKNTVALERGGFILKH
jgi:alpha-tubulin suppressor-like RCC1 family protein